MKSQAYSDLAYNTLTQCFVVKDFGILGESRKSLQDYLEEYIDFSKEYSLIDNLDYRSLKTNRDRCLFWHLLLISLSTVEFSDVESEGKYIIYNGTRAELLLRELNKLSDTEPVKNYLRKGIFDQIKYCFDVKKKIIQCCAYFYQNETTTVGCDGFDGVNLDSHLGFLIYQDSELSSKYDYREHLKATVEIIDSGSLEDIKRFQEGIIESMEHYGVDFHEDASIRYPHLNYPYLLLKSLSPLEQDTTSIPNPHKLASHFLISLSSSFLNPKFFTNFSKPCRLWPILVKNSKFFH